ncbi:hypothetical protein [Leeuwenhoekiella sp. W20_SRS_FM14]|uniref:hypothetical protein n=1 Tax=Leeuwenhoekiella sp. W20_SRS_FM14 TaxID=3240270 RepID=UPI003F991303
MIKVGYLISYDYDLVFNSLDCIYKHVDKIFFAIDENLLSWTGTKYTIPESFFEKLKVYDVDNKIEIYRDRFYIDSLSPIECETRERNLLLQKMGRGWKIQLDADEYIPQFDKVVRFLKKNIFLTYFPQLTPIAFRGKLITLFKKVEGGYVYIENNESFSFITNFPKYEFVRANNSIRNHDLGVYVIHQSWARSKEEIEFKVKNWGHRDDFNTDGYLRFWETISKENYTSIKNFHPIAPHVWNRLHFKLGNSIPDLIELFSNQRKQQLNEISMGFFIRGLVRKLRTIILKPHKILAK